MDSVRFTLGNGMIQIHGWASGPVYYSPESLALAIANLDRFTPSTTLSADMIERWRGVLTGAMAYWNNAKYASDTQAAWAAMGVKGGEM